MQISGFKGRTLEKNVQFKLAIWLHVLQGIAQELSYFVLFLFFNQAVWEQKSKRMQVCNCRNTKHASFAAFSTTTAAFTSSAVNKYLRQSSLSTLCIRQTLNPVWDAFTAIWSLLSHSLQHTHTFHFQHCTYPACKVASIFHSASCNIERYGPWFHLCGAVVALLSVPEWNSCGSMSLICQSQTDGVSMCCRELQWSISKLQLYR